MQTIGRYQLVEKLGQGGMGVVYRAFDPLLQRVVAVKLIGAIEADAAVKERFFREARAAGQLAHKNIITIYDMGEHEGQPFLAMEYLEGQDLQQRMLSQVPMSLARKLELATELCEGIEYAHSHGVIHRDIKPANIFLTTTGTTKILDFGLARLITSELTNSNMMMGTLNYMAPEQVRGERADHRSDIFSTGVVLYELFGGRKAFEGDSFGATLYKILEEVPEPLLNLDATLPPAVIAIIERALEKARDDRYPSMSEMLRDLSLYRQQYLLANTPPLGAPSDVTRVPSDLPRRSVVGPLSPSSGTPAQPPMLAHDAPTIAAPTPVPVGNPGSGNRPVTAMSPDAGSGSFTASPSRTRTLVATVIGVSVLVVALAVWGFLKNSGSDTRPEANPAAAPSAQETQQAIASRLEQASKALQSGDQAEAERQADAVLAISPGHPEASALRDRARQATDTVQRGLASARELMTSGRFEEASRAAGEVLSVDPNNEEAKNLINDAATRSSGRGVEQARQRMTTSKNAAIAAAASKLAAAPYGAALAAEREAQSLYKQEKMAEAVVKFSEATGLFRSAEIAAHTEAAARKERARAEASKPAPPAESEKTPEPKPEPIAPPLPTTPVPPVAGAGTLPKSSSVAVPQPPPSAPPPPAPQPAPAEARPAPSATALITEVLEQYESALERRDLAALKRVWPSLGGTQEAAIRSDFRNSKRIEVEIVSPQIALRDDTATVRFLRRYTFDSVEGPTYQSQSNTTMTLQRNGNTWAITQIQYVPVR